jgi:hypothetical protein
MTVDGKVSAELKAAVATALRDTSMEIGSDLRLTATDRAARPIAD